MQERTLAFKTKAFVKKYALQQSTPGYNDQGDKDYRTKAKEDLTQVDKLNLCVDKQVKELVESKNEITPEVKAVLNGHTVFVERSQYFVYFLFFYSLYLLSRAFSVHGFLVGFTCMVLQYFWYDFFSGVVHVILDDPLNIDNPTIRVKAIGFQWHHRVPWDITDKTYVAVCADLNYVALPTMFWYFQILGLKHSPVGATMAASKLLSAYFGQFCHRSAHQTDVARGKVVTFLQKFGFLLSPDDHAKHHKTYDQMFCIGSGHCNDIIQAMYNKIQHRYFWNTFAIFLILTDLFVMSKGVCWLYAIEGF